MGCLNFLNELINLWLAGKHAGSDFILLWVCVLALVGSWIDRDVVKTEEKWVQLLLSLLIIS